MTDKLTLENQKRNLTSLLFELGSIKRKRLNLDNHEKLLRRNIAKKQKSLRVTLKESNLLVSTGGLFLETTFVLDEEARILLDWREESSSI